MQLHHFALLALFVHGAATSQSSIQLTDDRQRPRPLSESSEPSFLGQVGPRTLLSAHTWALGREPYVYEHGTDRFFALPEAWPGPDDGMPRAPFVLGNTQYFVADTPEGTWIFSTDLTVPGTQRVVRFRDDIGPVKGNECCVSGARTYFLLDDGDHGRELWAWAGGTQRPYLVHDVDPGPGSGATGWLFPVSSGVVYLAHEWTYGTELWFSDGTQAGTKLIADLTPGPNSSLSAPVAFGGRLLFTAPDPARQRRVVWATDGSSAGTLPLTQQVEFWSSGQLQRNQVVVGNRLFFAGDDGTGQVELWVTDGTSAGTRLFLEIEPGPAGCQLGEMQALANGRFAFVADTFAYGRELWISDGTPAGTKMVADLVPGSGASNARWIVPFGNGLLFCATDGKNGHEPWISDGTAAGTRLLLDVNPGPGSSNPIAIECGPGQALLAATDASHGCELWITDGTMAGTRLRQDIQAKPVAYWGSNFQTLTACGERLYFVATTVGEGAEPWCSDGTAAGTRLLRDVQVGTSGSAPAGFTVVGSLVFFTADDGIHGRELWASDGSSNGTQLLADFSSGRTSTWPYVPPVVIAYRGRAWFAAPDPVAGTELWSSNGTPAGTVRAFDLEAGSGSSIPEPLGVLRGRLLFAASVTPHGRELWSSDGTPLGTMLVRDVHAGAADGLGATTPCGIWRDRLWFVANDGTHGAELWVSDGTPAGTSLLADLQPGPAGSAPTDFVWNENDFYFVADDGKHGRELWRSDGTAAGTALRHDLFAGAQDGGVGGGVPLGIGVVFVAQASGPDRGQEPYYSEPGLPAPRLLLDVAPGPYTGTATPLLAAGRQVYFVGRWAHGTPNRLYVTDGTVAGTRIVPTGLRPSAWAFGHGRLWLAAGNERTSSELWRWLPESASSERSVLGCSSQATATPELGTDDPRLGHTVGLRGRMFDASAAVALLLGAVPPVPLEYAPGCALAFDPVGVQVVEALLPLGGGFSRSLAIPSAPALLGVRVAWQAAQLQLQGPLRLDTSNGVHWYVGR